MTSPASVLAGARVVLEERGWCQGADQDAEGCVCSEYALSIAAWSDERPLLAYLTGKKALRSAINAPSVVLWNDTPGRTFDEVLAAFVRAEELAARGQA